MSTPQNKEHWTSPFGFIMAMAGSAIGLGNIWRFSYVAGKNGGGAFLIIYCFCVLMVGVPILLCELAMGRAAQTNPMRTFASLTKSNTKLSSFLGLVLLLIAIGLLCSGMYFMGTLMALTGLSLLKYGWWTLGVFYGAVTPLFILCYYGVVGGWTVIYLFKSLLGQLSVSTAAEASAVMNPIIMAPKGHWTAPLLATLFFTLGTGTVIYLGVQKGIERFSKIFMPILGLLLLVLIFRGLSLPGASKGVKFLLVPDFSSLSANSVLAALGHAFYSLSLGMGITITYGSYLKPNVNLPRAAITVAFLDTLVSLLAGLAIFPLVFAMGFSPAGGPSLIFQVLPLAFQKLPLSHLWDLIFFFAVLIAAITSSVSLLEAPVSIIAEEFKWKRGKVLFLLMPCLLAVSLLISLCSGSYDNFPALGRFVSQFFGSTQGSLFDVFDVGASQWFIPMVALATLMYSGWVWGTQMGVWEMRVGSSGIMDTNVWLLLSGVYEEKNSIANPSSFSPGIIWGFFIRFISPILVILAFLDSLGIFK